MYLKLHPFKQFTLVQKSTHKLSAKYCGPFRISKRIGAVAYELILPSTARVHNVFHVCLLKKCWRGSDESELVVSGFPEELNQEKERGFYPLKVLDRKMVRHNNMAKAMWLIQWLQQGEDGATWEYADEIRKRFPEFRVDS